MLRPPDADWTDASRFSRAILSIHWLRELPRDPFTLKLLTVIPQLVMARAVTLANVEVYAAFVRDYFEREMWKDPKRGEVLVSEDRPARLGALGETIRQAVFVAATTTAAIRFVDGYSKLLRGLPGQQHEDRSLVSVDARVLHSAGGNASHLRRREGALLATAEMGMLGFIH